jgi:hypothetical protein
MQIPNRFNGQEGIAIASINRRERQESIWPVGSIRMD